MLKKHWWAIFILWLILFGVSSLLLSKLNHKYRDKQGLQSSELASQVALGYLIDENYLALQSQLNQLLYIEGLLSISITSADFEVLAKAQHADLIGPNVRYYSRPIRLDADNQQIIGYVQVAWSNEFNHILYVVAWIISLFLTILIVCCGWLISHWHSVLLYREIERLQQQLNQWAPADTKGVEINSVQICYIVFYFEALHHWQQSFQPQIANSVLNQFENDFNQQLDLYGGKVVGNLHNSLQIVVFDCQESLSCGFAFASGVIHVLSQWYEDMNLPLSAMVLTDVGAPLSQRSLLQLPLYKKSLVNHYRQLQQLQQQSLSNHLIVAKSEQHLFESSAVFSETPIDDWILATPNDLILQLWRRQLSSHL